MESKYIIEAIIVLKKLDEMLMGEMTPQQKGKMSAQCCIVATQLQIHSGIGNVQIEIEEETAPFIRNVSDDYTEDDYTDYTMRQGELGNPDRSR